jgi:hypothetical protein
VNRLSAFWFVVAYGDDRVERVTFYAPSQAEADKYAHGWARRMGVGTEPTEETA